MGLEDYISETEAATLSGVSVASLNRFIEAGYLQVEEDSDGLRLFSRGELINLFGLQEFERECAEQHLEKAGNGSAENGHWTREAVDTSHLTSPTDGIRPWPGVNVNDSDYPAKVALAPKPALGVVQTSHAVQLLEGELRKLRQLNDLQEKLLQLRDKELHDLREQREWLKVRLERLEEKGERDQILLLSETQTIRKLIHLQEHKPSPIRLALDWLGITSPTSVSTQVSQKTVDVSGCSGG